MFVDFILPMYLTPTRSGFCKGHGEVLTKPLHFLTKTNSVRYLTINSKPTRPETAMGEPLQSFDF